MHFDVFVASLDKVLKTLGDFLVANIIGCVAANIDRLVRDYRIGRKGLQID